MKERISNIPKPAQPPTGEVSAFIADLSDDDLRKLAREKLSEALQAIDPKKEPEMTRRLCAEVKDRIDGKPGQALTIDQTLRTINVTANISFIPARIGTQDMVIEQLPIVSE